MILVLRRGVLSAALSGTAAAFLAVLLGRTFHLDAPGGLRALASSGILTLSALLVILPGLYLNAILRAQGSAEALSGWVQDLPLIPERKALLLVFGMLPAIEAMTGFGISLFMAIPILFRLFPPGQAYRLSMVGMNIMPWGTLALATTVGASLSGYSLAELGRMTSATSFLVFPALGMLVSLVITDANWHKGREIVVAGMAGLSLSILLWLFNRVGWVEMAGILAGGLNGVLMLGCLRGGRKGAASERGRFQALRAILPYGIVLASILSLRLIQPLRDFLSHLIVLQSGQIRLSLLASPGVALLVAILVLVLRRPVGVDHRIILGRVATAGLSLFCLVLLSQIMNEAGLIALITHGFRLDHGPSLVIAPLVGVGSGFLTGSNLGGNALVMGVQQRIGAAFGQGLLFAGLQNSSAGHAVFTSLPILVLILTLARDSGTASPSEGPGVTEHELLRFGLKSLALIYGAVTVMGLLLGLRGIPTPT